MTSGSRLERAVHAHQHRGQGHARLRARRGPGRSRAARGCGRRRAGRAGGPRWPPRRPRARRRSSARHRGTTSNCSWCSSGSPCTVISWPTSAARSRSTRRLVAGQGARHLGVHAQRAARWPLHVGGQLLHLVVDLRADGGHALDHPAARAVGAGLAERALQRLLHALAGQDHEAELVHGKDLRRRAVAPQLLLERGHHLLAALPLLHVDEVDDDDAAQVAQADLAHDLLHRLQVGLEDRLLEVLLARVAAGVDVDRHQRLGLVDDDVAARLQPDLGAQRALQLARRRRAPRGCSRRRRAGARAAPARAAAALTRSSVRWYSRSLSRRMVAMSSREQVAQQALHQAQLAVQQRRARARGAARRAHLVPGAASGSARRARSPRGCGPAPRCAR